MPKTDFVKLNINAILIGERARARKHNLFLLSSIRILENYVHLSIFDFSIHSEVVCALKMPRRASEAYYL